MIEGELDPLCFYQAWNIVYQKNRVLQSAIEMKDSAQYIQVFPVDSETPFFYQDLSLCVNAEKISLQQDEALWDQQDDYSRNLIRLYLRKIAEKRYHLVICFHHVLMDGWSYMILLQQLSKSYDALLTNKIVENKKDRYLEYLKWKQTHLSDHEDFWIHKLYGIANAPDDRKLFYDMAYYLTRNHYAMFSINENNYISLKSCAALVNVTIVTLLYAFWSITYTQWSQNKDFLLGLVVSGRNNTPMNMCETIGLFMETLPLRIQINLEQSCLELTSDIADQIIQAQEHPLVEFSRICSNYGIPGISQMMVIQNYPTDSVNCPGGYRLSLLSSRYALTTPLVISLRDDYKTGSLLVEYSYHPFKYSRGDIERLWCGFQYMLTHSSEVIKCGITEITHSLDSIG